MTQIEPIHNFAKPARPTVLGLRRSAVLEMIFGLAVLLALDILALNGTRYWHVNPHPFWIVVLFIACKYGTREGLVAALASSIALLFGNLPEQSLDQDSYDYLLTVLKMPLLWLVASVGFGELRQMHIREREYLEGALIGAQEREQSIAQSYEWVKQLKDQLELRVAGQLRSAITIYRAAKKMETLSPTEALEALEELVSSALAPQEFSIYLLNDKGLALSVMHGWKEEDTWRRHFDQKDPLFQAVVGQREVVCVANADHERILSGQGLIAGPLIDRDTDEVVGMLKVEKMNFTDLHLSNIQAFTTIGEWAGMTIANARKYQTAKEGSLINPDHNLFTTGYFVRYNDYITSLARRIGFDVSKLTIKMINAEHLDGNLRLRVARALADSVEKVLRDVDLAFEQRQHSEEYSIMLPATSRQGAEVVMEKIRSSLEESAGKVSEDARFSFSVQTVYETRH